MSEATLAATRHFWITVKANSGSFQLKLRKNHAICDKQRKFKKEISLARTNSKTTFFPSAENLLETLTTQKACLLVMLIISIVIVCVNFFLSQVRSHCLESLVDDLSCFPSNITKYTYFHMIPFPFINDYIQMHTDFACLIFDAILTQTLSSSLRPTLPTLCIRSTCSFICTISFPYLLWL